MLSRRVVIASVVGAVTLAATAACGAVNTVGDVDFNQRLHVPPLAESTVDAQGRRVFDLVAQTGSLEVGDQGRVETWGFNGDYLGPTLRAKRGETVLVNVVNMVNESTSVHWHGMHLPARMDGGPHQEVRPGATWSPTWTVDQPAATLWYHPHPHGVTEEHVTRGLAGMFILDDEGGSHGVPDDYGVDDVPVIVQDRSVGGDGRFNDSDRGDTILVNGTVGPYLDVTTEKVRLRLLNASTSRVYDFGLADDRAFALVATDGGFLEQPAALNRIRLSPGERAEIVVAFTPGETTVLRSYPPDLGDNFFADVFGGGRDQFDVLQLRAASRLVPSGDIDARLAPIERLDPRDADRSREFRLSGTSINQQKMDLSRVDEVVEVGATEVWDVSNQDGQVHNFHVHDVQFQVLQVDGRAPDVTNSGWKDTVMIQPNQTVRLIMRFPDYPDPTTPYMYHCHLLMHEDSGMMGQFVVVEPGQRPAVPGPATGHDHSN
jgi:FtsP/CotA-like multicopper oxidase with cupredoxin domain